MEHGSIRRSKEKEYEQRRSKKGSKEREQVEENSALQNYLCTLWVYKMSGGCILYTKILLFTSFTSNVSEKLSDDSFPSEW